MFFVQNFEVLKLEHQNTKKNNNFLSSLCCCQSIWFIFRLNNFYFRYMTIHIKKQVCKEKFKIKDKYLNK